MTKFINTYTKYNINQENLEIYNSNYITKKFEYKNADIVYKLKEKEIYFLIEHQTSVDYSMSYRILNYCVEIIKSAVKTKEMKKVGYRYPKVIPIVLYTGNQKWTASKSFAKIQTEDENFETKNIDAKYQLIDINKCEIEKLLNQKTMLGNVMILEKCKNNAQVEKYLTEILKNIKDNEELAYLSRIVTYLYGDIDEKINELFEKREVEEKMSTIRERIYAEFKNERRIGMNIGIAQGIAQSVRKIVEQMIKMNLEDDFIKEATGAKKVEIQKIRKEIGCE